MLNNLNYNPDVLTCLANLSSDEVFTPPAIANQLLDLLPPNLWRDKNAKFLDPVTKSGVFLREIAKRLMDGLADDFPDMQVRANHILQNQLFGIAITELTALLSRRSVYCTKTANGKFSVCEKFGDKDGNIRFANMKHCWENGRCIYCGASEAVYARDEKLEQHAYEFIHTEKPEVIFKMTFDVIIGNPPYQLSDGGNSASAIPLYHKFIEQAKKLNPRYLTMIVPSRWFSGGRGLDDFRSEMLHDDRIRIICDYFNSNDCFPGIDLSGGVCYFLWERDNRGDCQITSNIGIATSVMTRPLLEENYDSFIRFNSAISIIRKISAKKEPSFSSIVSSLKPFGLRTYVQGGEKKNSDSVKLYANRNVNKNAGYISREEISINKELIDDYKVYISRAYGERGDFPYLVLGKPFLGEPNSCCTETFLVIGTFNSETIAKNVISYIQTRFFRFLVLQQKNTQDAPKRVYSFVPMQDFSQSWTDEILYQKYQLTAEEIAFIESMIRPMDLSENHTAETDPENTDE